MIRAVHAEWTKLRTSPGTFWLLAAVVVATAGLSALAAGAEPCRLPCSADLVKVSLTGVQLGQAVVAILATLVIGGEYSTGMVRVSLAAVPSRSRLLLAKALVVLAVTLPAAALGVAGSVLAGRWLLPAHALVGRAVAGSVLYLALIGLLSLGLAVAVRQPAVAVGAVLGLLYAWPIVARVVTDPKWSKRLDQWGPMSAGTAIQATRDLASLPISPWDGLEVLALWAFGALLLGWLVLLRRDA